MTTQQISKLAVTIPWENEKMMNRQSQKGGDESTNIQAEHMVLNLGIDEKRAREIFQEMQLQVRSDFTQDAYNLANERVQELEDRLMPKMQEVDGALSAFADPSFQFLLVEAQKAAASTERLVDYDLLSQLLIHRFQKGENRGTRAGINRAVKIVEEVSDEGLLGLTVAHAIVVFSPAGGGVLQGLDTLNDLFGRLISEKLPVGTDWIDHLDLLGAVRFNPLGGFKKLEPFFVERLHGYVDVGLKKGSENLDRAKEILNQYNVPLNLLIEHELNKDYMRLNVNCRDGIKLIEIIQSTFSFGADSFHRIVLSDSQIGAIHSVYDLYERDDKLKQNNVALFMEEWNKRSNLKVIREWWDGISSGFQITAVGKVLAHSNAQRCDNTLPSLD